MASKIYCSQCSHFIAAESTPISYSDINYDKSRDLCMSPNNFKDGYALESQDVISTPYIINRFNDCIWFEAIEEDESSSSSS